MLPSEAYGPALDVDVGVDIFAPPLPAAAASAAVLSQQQRASIVLARMLRSQGAGQGAGQQLAEGNGLVAGREALERRIGNLRQMAEQQQQQMRSQFRRLRGTLQRMQEDPDVVQAASIRMAGSRLLGSYAGANPRHSCILGAACKPACLDKPSAA